MQQIKLTIILAMLAAASVVMAQMPSEVNDLFAEKPKGENQAGKRDCDQAKKDEEKAAADNMDNPMAGVAATKKVMCSALEQIAWKPVKITSLPKKAKAKGVPGDKDVLKGSKDWWAATDDGNYVKVLSAGITDTKWNTLTMSDNPGVASARAVGGYHVIKAKLATKKDACFVVPTVIKQDNLNYPDPLLKPKWGASQFSIDHNGKGQEIACSKAK